MTNHSAVIVEVSKGSEKVLFVRSMTGETYTIDFEPTDTIEDIKYHIHDRTG